MRTGGPILTAFLLTAALLPGCGRKYPLPPVGNAGMPPESSYVRVEGWPEVPVAVQGVRDLFLGRDGFLYVADAQGLRRLYTNGAPAPVTFAGLEAPVAVAQAPDFSLWVVDSALQEIHGFSLSAEPIRQFAIDRWLIARVDTVNGQPDTVWQSIVPGGLTVDDQFRLYLSCRNLDLVLVCDTAGRLLDTLAGPGSGILNVAEPRGLDYWNGAVYVASTGHNWVEALSVDTPRTNLLHLGGTSHAGDTAAGFFRQPVDVSVDTTGAVYVADYGNARVQKFSASGAFIVETRNPDDSTARPLSCATTPDGMTLYIAFHSDQGDWLEKYTRPVRPGGNEGGTP